MDYEDVGVFVEPQSWEAVGLQLSSEPERHNPLCVSPKLFSVHLLYSSCKSTFSAPQDHLVKYGHPQFLNLHFIVPVRQTD